MKVLKWIGIVFLILIAVFLIFSASQADKITLEESITIDAPKEMVFAEISNFKKWKSWSTWSQIDSNMVSTFSEEVAVVGAWNEWQSSHPEVGNGRQEIVEIRENEYTKVALNFEGMEEPVHAEMILEEVERGTQVRWTFEGNDLPFYLGWLNALIAPALKVNYQSSLKNLKKQLEAMPKTVPMPEPLELVELEAQPIISIIDSTDGKGLSKLLGQLYTELGIFASANEGIEIDGMPMAIYHNYSPEKVVLEAAMPITGAAQAQGRVKVGEIGAGKAVKAIHYGDYDASEDMHYLIGDYLSAADLEMISSPYEIYANDPTLVDSAAVETHIYYPVK